MTTKRNFIKLVEDVKDNGEIIYSTYVTPAFIPVRKVIEATEILSNGEEHTEAEMFDIMLDFIVDIYGNQFSKNDLLDKLNGPGFAEELEQQVTFIIEGKINEDKKKELAKIL